MAQACAARVTFDILSRNMYCVSVFVFALQTVCLSCAFALGYWLNAPWPVLGSLVLFSAGVLGWRFIESERRLQARHGLILVRTASCVVIISIAIWHRESLLRTLCAATAWLLALAILLNDFGPFGENTRRKWRAWWFVWAFIGMLLWFGAAYLQNARAAFFIAVGLTVALLLLWKWWLRPGVFGIQVANTFILALIGLPIVSFFHSHTNHAVTPTLDEKPYSYEVARKDPEKYARWTRYIRTQMDAMERTIFRSGQVRTNVEFTLVQSRISINSKGFRGEEIPVTKGNAYRIVALGESTTFGITMTRDDEPWPQILEEQIRQRLQSSRPVEVINAGLPGYTLERNLSRVVEEILPLKPDMIISYHGLNEFPTLYAGLPPIQGGPPPPYPQRPLKLLADVEDHFRLLAYRREYSPKGKPTPAYISSPMESEYAEDYRRLIEITRTNGIHLVLATYSMAANQNSPVDAVDFYRQTFPGVKWLISANIAHTQIIKRLAREDPRIGFVDTQPALDGRYELYIDLCHFTPEGRRRLAEVFFSGIRGILENELGKPNSLNPNVKSIAE